MQRLRMNQAIAAAMSAEMEADESVILMGEDVAAAEGVFKTSEGMLERFGATRVRDTPISEMGFMGAGVGAAMRGVRPIVEIMFVEFLGVALDQLVTTAAKMRYMSGGTLHVPLTVRASIGAGAGFGCQHSQTCETWMAATPGLKVAVASGPRTAYGLVRAAIRDDDPVVVLEPRVLYGTREQFDPADTGVTLGSVEMVQPGEDVTVVGLGTTVTTVREAVEGADWSAEVIDLLTLYPWDATAVRASVRKTGRLVVVEETPRTGGWGADIVADVATHCHGDLVAPPVRVTAPDAPVPYGSHLEKEYLPDAAAVRAQIDSLVATGEPVPAWWEVTA
ncbi:MAG: transketolase C-terminal domain-containing protein [Acidimicrobiales bacterium]